MRKRASLILAAAAAMLLCASGIAVADENVQTEQATVTPTKLPKKNRKNVTLANTITTFDAPGTFQPPKATRTILDLPKQIKIDTKAAKFCKTDANGLSAAATAADAKKLCGGKSQVSSDKGSSAQVRVGSAVGATVIDVDVVAFNEDGKKLLIYAKPTGSFAGISASILIGKLKGSKSGSAYGQALDVSIPPLAAGAISFFKVTIDKDGYLKANCKPKTLQFQAKTFFTDGSNTADTYTQECKPKG